MFRSIFLYLILFSLIFSTSVPSAFADFAIRPGNFDGEWHMTYDLAPGMKIKDSVLVKNLSDEELTLSIDVFDAHVGVDNPDIFSIESSDQTKDTVGAWIMLDKPLVTVPPQDSELVKFDLLIPEEGVVIGEQYTGAITVMNNPSAEVTGAGAIVRSRMGQRIYVNVVEPENAQEIPLYIPWHYVGVIAGLLVILAAHVCIRKKKKGKKKKKK
ncbi:hypothetical protein HOG48_03165 [Candidatus Peregrinibacteria bacterium]|jgi:hypothetical protein|nr:hypothetical protein [Candidatus Peregrinibacteria bacterium]